MALYLVVHTPVGEDDGMARGPSRLLDLAREHGTEGSRPRWVRTWSPDLHDDRIFTLWEAPDADAILVTLTTFGYLDHMEAKPLRVQEWGPADILAAEGGDESLAVS
ncbi:MAG: hypothetical protein AVDCRST_MAG87-2727 [uncultured Thermomicrobiales bacterium]|uniref:Uncharacterized protein n=1 Tax=uncultured Thermomicrobiales bacterium TaxID=1645740 RepID=A0A6J4VAY4_9BACT|nr:MAG: hypothetical protein AVDCRST_MAG87-2727 [uncultured Thermomicrobiales bacterium]